MSVLSLRVTYKRAGIIIHNKRLVGFVSQYQPFPAQTPARFRRPVLGGDSQLMDLILITSNDTEIISLHDILFGKNCRSPNLVSGFQAAALALHGHA